MATIHPIESKLKIEYRKQRTRNTISFFIYIAIAVFLGYFTIYYQIGNKPNIWNNLLSPWIKKLDLQRMHIYNQYGFFRSLPSGILYIIVWAFRDYVPACACLLSGIMGMG
ncbi:MAG: hypothetical protein PHI27_08000 [Eubacteriales bacterium]|nr:hypothetical protein [Eubacteriales bacterium]MDD3882180.1 hypothetical protein [Eubacteriales bacterium]MDD4513776.1 hypothetical protein [Eubacteriales bacterium]